MTHSVTLSEPLANKAPAMAATKQLDLVQGLRGLAALGVLTHHIAVGIDRWFGAGFTPPGFGLGWVGVDLFFVLSGFIMVWTTQTAGHGLKPATAFWTRRVLRVYPPYWAAWAMAAALTTMLPGIVTLASADFWASLFLWPAEHPPFLHPGWTLIYELWFYLGFGLLMLAPRRFLPTLLGGWALGVLLTALRFGQEVGPLLHVISNPLTLNFLMGAGVALALIHWPGTLPRPALLSLIGFGSLWLLAGAFYVTETGWNEWTRMLACGPASALVLAGAALLDREGRLAPPKPLVILGDWSYALYLTHQPIVYAVTLLSAQAFGAGWTGVGVAVLGGLTLPFLATAILHQGIEKPAQTAGRRLARGIEGLR
jgi:exopolysaccharide production protein ExoZ